METALRILAETRIAAAIADGAFDDLPGRGVPLNLEDESSVPQEWRVAYRLLHSSGLAPAWIDMGDEIRRSVDQARASLAAVDRSDARRTQAEALYAARARVLNMQIARYNLQAPAARWHIAQIDVGRDWLEVHIGNGPPTAPDAATPSNFPPVPISG
jgi:hypothetical protein